VRIGIEGRTLVMLKELQVANEVYDQKGAQEQARNGHDNLSTDAATQGFVYPTHK
jgi:hypothetical protein